MAGRGPAPKDPSQRRNHHAPQRGEWVDLEPLDTPVLPELAKTRDNGEEWPARTRAAWQAWRTDPVTAQYSPADISTVFDLVELHAEWCSGKSCANEVRLRMDGLGLTPKGKRDLRWRIPSGPALQLKTASRRRAPKRAADRLPRLTVVK